MTALDFWIFLKIDRLSNTFPNFLVDNIDWSWERHILCVENIFCTIHIVLSCLPDTVANYCMKFNIYPQLYRLSYSFFFILDNLLFWFLRFLLPWKLLGIWIWGCFFWLSIVHSAWLYVMTQLTHIPQLSLCHSSEYLHV
jgi:hypothetical protein